MKLYVDGNDLLEALAAQDSDIVVVGDRAKSRLNLARWLWRYAQHQDCDVVLVFEGEPDGRTLAPSERHGRVRVVNLEPGAAAMHEIAGPANRAARDDRVFVVTSDARLAEAMRRGRARVLEPLAFIRRARKLMRGAETDNLDEPDAKFSGLSDEEVEHWMRLFSEDTKGSDDQRP